MLAQLLESSFVQLILNASLLVKAVMLLLMLISLFSWTLIFSKSRALGKARRVANEFESRFWRDKDFTALYSHINSYEEGPLGVENVFVSGYMEFARLRKQPGVTQRLLLEGVQRVMRVALQREADDLEKGLSTLATIGSVSPYIGLFGTVWGIMNSFHALSQMQQVTLAMVAPGISEALIATAMGLFAAIPAVMAYNNYVESVDRLMSRYEIFLDEFTTILQRQLYLTPPVDLTR